MFPVRKLLLVSIKWVNNNEWYQSESIFRAFDLWWASWTCLGNWKCISHMDRSHDFASKPNLVELLSWSATILQGRNVRGRRACLRISDEEKTGCCLLESKECYYYRPGAMYLHSMQVAKATWPSIASIYMKAEYDKLTVEFVNSGSLQEEPKMNCCTADSREPVLLF